MKKILLILALVVAAYVLRQPIIHHLFAINTTYTENTQPNADILVFSYDRPLQLTAFLDSTEKYVTGIDEIHVIYRSSEASYREAYTDVQHAFPQVHFHAQGKNPKEDFKPLTLEVMQKSTSDFVIFAVDDNIVTDPIDVKQAVQELIDTQSFAFIFRLGENRTAVAGGERMDVPVHTLTNRGHFLWVVKNGKGLWRYAHNLDFTLYNKNEIFDELSSLNFSAPNTMEEAWSRKLFVNFFGLRPWSKANFKKLLAPKTSKIVNLPLNLVNEERINPSIANYPKEKLLALFNEGVRIDVDAYAGNRSPHAFLYEEPKFRVMN